MADNKRNRDLILAYSIIEKKYYVNKKHNTVYKVLDIPSINCTNNRDGEVMIEYYATDIVGIAYAVNLDQKYCREVNEFIKKFKPLQ